MYVLSWGNRNIKRESMIIVTSMTIATKKYVAVIIRHGNRNQKRYKFNQTFFNIINYNLKILDLFIRLKAIYGFFHPLLILLLFISL